jgi:hypothetical protein
MSAIAFHEKAGRSQGRSSPISIPRQKVFFAELTLSPPFHPLSGWAIFARCKLGVLISVGAATPLPLALRAHCYQPCSVVVKNIMPGMGR